MLIGSLASYVAVIGVALFVAWRVHPALIDAAGRARVAPRPVRLPPEEVVGRVVERR
jgi:hypothetical protein